MCRRFTKVKIKPQVGDGRSIEAREKLQNKLQRRKTSLPSSSSTSSSHTPSKTQKSCGLGIEALEKLVKYIEEPSEKTKALAKKVKKLKKKKAKEQKGRISDEIEIQIEKEGMDICTQDLEEIRTVEGVFFEVIAEDFQHIDHRSDSRFCVWRKQKLFIAALQSNHSLKLPSKDFRILAKIFEPILMCVNAQELQVLIQKAAKFQFEKISTRKDLKHQIFEEFINKLGHASKYDRMWNTRNGMYLPGENNAVYYQQLTIEELDLIEKMMLRTQFIFNNLHLLESDDPYKYMLFMRDSEKILKIFGNRHLEAEERLEFIFEQLEHKRAMLEGEKLAFEKQANREEEDEIEKLLKEIHTGV